MSRSDRFPARLALAILMLLQLLTLAMFYGRLA